MSGKSLRARKKAASKAAHKERQKLNANLHLIAGEHKHNHTHSITPISADEIQKLSNIDPSYPNRLFTLMENSLDAEKEETKRYYDAIQREQDNDKLSILKQSNDNSIAIIASFVAMVFFMICGSILIYFNHEVIGGTIVTTVLGGIVKAILTKKNNKKEDEE